MTKNKWFIFRNYMATLACGAFAGFFLYQLTQDSGDQFILPAIIFSFAFVVTILLNFKSKYALNKEIKSSDTFFLLPNEEIVKEYVGITVDGFAFLSYHKLWFKNFIITNKRVTLSSNYFGVESWKSPPSLYYHKNDYEQVNKIIGLKMYELYKKGKYTYFKGKRSGWISSITWKIKDEDNELYNLVKRYYKGGI